MFRSASIRAAAAAANYTGSEPRTIYRLCAQDDLPHVRLGHRLFSRTNELGYTFAGASEKRGASTSGSQSSKNGAVV